MPSSVCAPAPGDDQGPELFQDRTRTRGIFREEVMSETGWFCPHCGNLDDQSKMEEGHIIRCSQCRKPFYLEVSKLFISRSLVPVNFSNQN